MLFTKNAIFTTVVNIGVFVNRLEYFTMDRQEAKVMDESADRSSPFQREIIKYIGAKTIVEIGVAWGSTTKYLCEGAKETGGHVYGFDIWSTHGLNNQFNTIGGKDKVEEHLKNHGLDNYTLTQIDSFSQEFKELLPKMCPKIDFCFIDGCHSYDGVKNDFELVYPLLSDGGVIVFDDTTWIDGTREFTLDLRTKYNDGTFDLVDLPRKLHGPNLFGQSFLFKRNRLNYPIGEICGSPSTMDKIILKEREWLEAEKK
jgi:predicted O-methyltransferase YrrM